MTQGFAYHRSLSPMMWVLVAISVGEMAVVHLLVALWNFWVALGLTVLSVGAIIWLISVIRSFKRLPVILDDESCLLRAGKLASITVERANIAGMRGQWSRADLKDRGTLNLALIAYPNIYLDLIEPIKTRRKTISSVAHRLDDPQSFVSALEAQG